MSESYQFDSGDIIRDLFKWMLQEKIVDSVIGFQAKKSRYQLDPVAIEDPEQITDLSLSAYMVYNFTRMNSAAKFLHKSMNGAKDKKVALIARPCDIRGLQELSKRNQVNLDNLFIIGTECYGTLPFQEAPKMYQGQELDPEQVVKESLSSDSVTLWFDGGTTTPIKLNKKFNRWETCQMCPDKMPEQADLALANVDGTFILTAQSQKGKDVLKKALDAQAISIEKADASILEKKDSLMHDYIENARAQRDSAIAVFLELSPEERYKKVVEMYEKCRRCGVCIRSCPVCFCKDCIVLQKKDDLDPGLYCFTRLGHMGDSCISCGKCSQNCPAKIPLAFLHLIFLKYIQNAFGFVPGKKEVSPPRSGESIKKPVK